MAGDQPLKPTRREFCAWGAAALVGPSVKTDRPIAPSFVNESFPPGHLLRRRAQFPAPPVGLPAHSRRSAEVMYYFRAGGRFAIPWEWALPVKRAARIKSFFPHWLKQTGFFAKPLLWSLNYACRDDYGALAADTSAWA